MQKIVEKLIKLNKTISTMESCTGGFLASQITNINSSSKVFKFGAVTYSNEYKIKMGVDPKVIDKYTVYSEQTANSMSYTISNYTNSDYGIGITGKLNRKDEANPYNEDNIIYISIYDRLNDKYFNKTVSVTSSSREKNKELVILVVKTMLNDII